MKAKTELRLIALTFGAGAIISLEVFNLPLQAVCCTIGMLVCFWLTGHVIEEP